MSSTDPLSPRHGLRLLRRHTEGTLVFDERSSPQRFIIDGRDGSIVMPVEVAAVGAVEHVLFLPDEPDWVIQVLVSPNTEPLDSTLDEGVDRWRACHGDCTGRVWVACDIESARTETHVYDRDALMMPNTLREIEPRLVKQLNADLDVLQRLCRQQAGVDVADPLAVGVDPDGINVRARFGTTRIEFSDPIDEPQQAAEAINALLAGVTEGSA